MLLDTLLKGGQIENHLLSLVYNKNGLKAYLILLVEFVSVFTFHLRISTNYIKNFKSEDVFVSYLYFFDPEHFFQVRYRLVMVNGCFFICDHYFHLQWDGPK